MFSRNWKCVVVCAVLALCLSAVGTANAAPIVAQTNVAAAQADEAAWQALIPTLANDLANSDQPTFGSITPSVAGLYGSNTTALVDGSILSGSGYNGDTIQGYCLGLGALNSATITIAFNTSVNTLGYDITNIVTTHAYANSWPGMAYTVEVVTVHTLGSSEGDD